MFTPLTRAGRDTASADEGHDQTPRPNADPEPDPAPDPAPNPGDDDPEFDTRHRDPDWLDQQYWGEMRSMTEMAREAGVAYGTIRRYMNLYDIPIRSRNVAMRLARGMLDPTAVDRSTARTAGSVPDTAADADEPYKRADWLDQQYWQNRRSLNEMATLAGVSRGTIIYWMDVHEIDRRSQAEAQKLAAKRTDGGTSDRAVELSLVIDGDLVDTTWMGEGSSLSRKVGDHHVGLTVESIGRPGGDRT